jgi:hypothetical protein
VATKQDWKTRTKFAESKIEWLEAEADRLEYREDCLVTELAMLQTRHDYYRSLSEELQSSPEIKADTEGAFKRGSDHARTQVQNYLTGTVVQEITGLLREVGENITYTVAAPAEEPQDTQQGRHVHAYLLSGGRCLISGCTDPVATQSQ